MVKQQEDYNIHICEQMSVNVHKHLSLTFRLVSFPLAIPLISCLPNADYYFLLLINRSKDSACVHHIPRLHSRLSLKPSVGRMERTTPKVGGA